MLSKLKTPRRNLVAWTIQSDMISDCTLGL
jgi:hypothetical protein